MVPAVGDLAVVEECCGCRGPVASEQVGLVGKVASITVSLIERCCADCGAPCPDARFARLAGSTFWILLIHLRKLNGSAEKAAHQEKIDVWV